MMNVSSKVITFVAICLLVAIGLDRVNAYPSVYPTGTTIYDPGKAWNGYVVFGLPSNGGAVLIDMNGNEVRRWDGVNVEPAPMRILPGGYIVGASTRREGHQEAKALVQLDWDGNEVWRFDRLEKVFFKEESEDEEESEENEEDAEDKGEVLWSARQHHDWQREGDPVGYYSPDAEPLTSDGRTLILAHKKVTNIAVSDKTLGDDYVYEVSWDGKVLWDWLASDHVDEFGLSEDMRNVIHRADDFNEERGSFDWLHINAMAYVGPNKWYDEGDERFNPENIILSIRRPNVIAIVDRAGAIVWRMGPDYRLSEAWSEWLRLRQPGCAGWRALGSQAQFACSRDQPRYL